MNTLRKREATNGLVLITLEQIGTKYHVNTLGLTEPISLIFDNKELALNEYARKCEHYFGHPTKGRRAQKCCSTNRGRIVFKIAKNPRNS